MSSAGVTEVDEDSEAGGHGGETAAWDLLALAEAVGGVQALLSCSRPRCSATARDELFAASEIVGWVLEVLPEVPEPGGADDLLELQTALLRGQAALTAAAQHSSEATPWDDICTWLSRTRTLLTVSAASLLP